MKKKNQNLKIAAVFISIFVLLSVIFYFGLVGQSVMGWNEDFEDFSNEFTLDDTNVGTTAITLAYLELPKDTNNFSFTPDYDFSVLKTKSSDGKANIQYEVFNHNTNMFDVVYTNQWMLPHDSEGTTYFKMKGQEIYQTGIPDRITNNLVSKGVYERTYGCLDGMTIEQAKQLVQPSEGTSTYTYKCIYPGEYILLHDYNDDDFGDIYYFPKIITLGSEYILNNNVTFRLTITRNGDLEYLYPSDFDIELWNINTDLSTYYRFENGECNKIQLMTYQITSKDYISERQCRKANNLTPEISWDILIPILISIMVIVFFVFFFLRKSKRSKR